LGWEEETGRDRCVAIMRSFMDASPDVRGEFDEVIACDDRVIAVRMAWRGRGVKAGELEVTAGAVYVVENGHWKSADFYDAEDRRAVVARYVELGGGLSLLGDTPVERHARTFACRSAAADIDGVMAMLAEDWVQVDRRQLAWPEQHKNHYRAQQEAIWNGTADIRIEYDEVIACDGAVLAGIMTYRGTAEPAMGGGQFEYSVGNVQVTREGVTVRNEWFDPEDRDAIMRRYRELADG
jgi:hypothetical protein